jgi:hypothetical protein
MMQFWKRAGFRLGKDVFLNIGISVDDPAIWP